jgi:hypothetical protein
MKQVLHSDMSSGLRDRMLESLIRTTPWKGKCCPQRWHANVEKGKHNESRRK